MVLPVFTPNHMQPTASPAAHVVADGCMSRCPAGWMCSVPCLDFRLTSLEGAVFLQPPAASWLPASSPDVHSGKHADHG